MSALDKIQIELKGIATILKGSILFVPNYQRAYSWAEENVSEFYRDIYSSLQSGSEEYFLGSIVISQANPARPEIVDGQQRIATCSILISAIRDYFSKLDSEDGRTRAQMITNDYLAKKDLETLELLPKVHLCESDARYYSETIIKTPSERSIVVPDSNSTYKIQVASDKANSFIKNIVTTTNDPSKILISFIKYLEDNVKLIVVRVPDDSNAFTIFETLNDRGLALAVSDLIKNHLFSKSGVKLLEVQKYWSTMITRIEDQENEKAVIDYLRHYWSSTADSVREKDLFSKIKAHCSTSSSSVSFADQISQSSRVYSAIVSPDDGFWGDYEDSSKQSMQVLNSFGITQVRPMILSILRKFERNEVDKSLKRLVNWCTRFLIVGGLGSGALEQKFSESAIRISKLEIKDSNELAKSLISIIPSDIDFENAFAIAKVSKNAMARYYLRELELSVKKEKEPELVPNNLSNQMTLEHILPENPSTSWGSITQEEARANYKRIGNMCLLKKSINNTIGNKGFSEKKKVYKESVLVLTTDLCSIDQWSIDRIDQRQKELAKLAVKRWNI